MVGPLLFFQPPRQARDPQPFFDVRQMVVTNSWAGAEGQSDAPDQFIAAFYTVPPRQAALPDRRDRGSKPTVRGGLTSCVTCILPYLKSRHRSVA
jgi:hypothetical protein